MNFKTDTLLIVANGSSLGSYSLGASIDSFNCIARINNYTTAPQFQAYAGTQTNIWINGANQGLAERKVLLDRIIVLIPSVVLLHKGELIHKRIQKRLGVEPGDYEMADLETIKTFEAQVGLPRLTTGTMAILWGLLNFEQVIIHGFDYFVESKSHYFDSPFKRWLVDSGLLSKARKHNVVEEKRFVETLIETEQVHRLLDVVK